MMDSITFSEVLLILVAAIISLFVLYLVIRVAVKDGTSESRRLTYRQNDILLKLLNKHGVDKDEIIDLFIAPKKDLLPTLKNH